MLKNSLLGYFVFGFFLLSSCESLELNPDDVKEEIDAEAYKEQKQWFAFLCSKSLEGRYSGSAGIKKAADLIANIVMTILLKEFLLKGKA